VITYCTAHFETLAMSFLFNYLWCANINGSIPEAARSKTPVRGRSSAETVGSNPTGGMNVSLF